jgi:hypothetical protein
MQANGSSPIQCDADPFELSGAKGIEVKGPMTLSASASQSSCNAQLVPVADVLPLGRKVVAHVASSRFEI